MGRGFPLIKRMENGLSIYVLFYVAKLRVRHSTDKQS